MFEKEAEEYLENFADCANCKERWSICADSLDEYCLVNGGCYAIPKEQDIYIAGAKFGYNKAKEEHKGKCKTAYTKGIRTMANALKEYDRTEGAWTDYFEHKVEEVLKRLLKESEIKSEMFPEIILPKGSSEFIDKIIADAEKRIKEIKENE